MAHAPLYPRAGGLPVASDAYDVRLYIDGEPRRIRVDDRVPAANGHTLGAHLRSGSPWPSLIEKGYLHTYSSGYDHDGGDAGSDVYMLTGWVPEHIALQEPAFQREKTWARVYGAWRAGACMVTAGTSAKIPARATVPGLISGHCYSVVSMNDDRVVKLLNPWKQDGDGALHCLWDDLCVSFSVLCVNWDPARWCSARVQGSWQPNAQSVQYRLDSPPDTLVTLHLERHIDGRDCFIAVHAFPTDGRRVFNAESGGQMGTYTSARHESIRAKGPCTVVVTTNHAQQRSAFTLTAYADVPIALRGVPLSLAQSATMVGAWRGRSAGGNMRYATFRHNPQYLVRVESNDTVLLPRIRALVRTERHVAVNALLVRGNQRVSQVAADDVIASSGAYTRGIALCDASAVQPGAYTLVLSTFTPHESEFSLQIESSADALAVEALPAEGAGMYHRCGTGTSWTLELARPSKVMMRFYDQHAAQAPLQISRDRIAMAHWSANNEVYLESGMYSLAANVFGALDVYSEHPIALHSGVD